MGGETEKGDEMPEVIFAGPEGRLEGRYHPQKDRDAPIAIVLHPHPQFGGTMNNKVVYNLHYAFYNLGFTVLRFNFRGVGRSQGEYDQGIGELSDAATALDYLQSMNQNSKHCWVAGFSFGAWIGMQLLMRRPEITGFISVSPPANMYDFSFLAPCPSSGLIINGSAEEAPALMIRGWPAVLGYGGGEFVLGETVEADTEVTGGMLPSAVPATLQGVVTRTADGQLRLIQTARFDPEAMRAATLAVVEMEFEDNHTEAREHDHDRHED